MNKNSKTYYLFLDLLSMVGNTVDAVLDPPKLRIDYTIGREIKNSRKRKAQQRAMYKLQKQDYLKSQGSKSNRTVQFTDKARHQGLIILITRKSKRLPKGWRCYISFDIPEKQRSARKYLRQMLKAGGCRMEHQSLWSTDRDIAKELSALVRIHKIDNLIKVIVGQRIVANSQYLKSASRTKHGHRKTK